MSRLFSFVAAIVLAGPGWSDGFVFTYFTGNGEDGLHMASSEDGLTWTPLRDGKSFLQPEVGTEKLVRDPCVIKGPDGRFHMVWTCGWYERRIGVAHSDDLVTWSEQKTIPVLEHEPEAKNCWAPEIIWDPASSQYVIYWATTIPGRFAEGEGKGDGDLNHRMYCTTTKDFETFTETQLWYDPGFSVIDSTVLIPEPGRYIMFLKNETRHPAEKNIRIATAESILGPWSDASEPITGDYWAEGPTAVQIGEWIYVYFDRYTEHRYGAVRSKDLNTWEDVTDLVHFPEGFRHGTVLRVTEMQLEALR